jgi:hypothetical protein
MKTVAFPDSLIPPAEAGGESRPNLYKECFGLSEIPSTAVGGVSKLDLSTVLRGFCPTMGEQFICGWRNRSRSRSARIVVSNA